MEISLRAMRFAAMLIKNHFVKKALRHKKIVRVHCSLFIPFLFAVLREWNVSLTQWKICFQIKVVDYEAFSRVCCGWVEESCEPHIRDSICFNALLFLLTFIALLGLRFMTIVNCAKEFPLFAMLIVYMNTHNNNNDRAMIMHSTLKSLFPSKFFLRSAFLLQETFLSLLMILSFIHNHLSFIH